MVEGVVVCGGYEDFQCMYWGQFVIEGWLCGYMIRKYGFYDKILCFICKLMFYFVLVKVIDVVGVLCEKLRELFIMKIKVICVMLVNFVLEVFYVWVFGELFGFLIIIVEVEIEDGFVGWGEVLMLFVVVVIID